MIIVGLLGAKKESKRLPRKGYRDFGGKPMFQWNVEKGLRALDRMYVTSDYDYILDVSEKLGAIGIKRSDPALMDCPNIEYYRHCFKQMGDPDAFVAIQVNSPTVDYNLIVLTKKLLEQGVQEIMTVHPIEYGKDYHAQAPRLYGSIWAMTRERLESYGDPYKPTPDVLLIDPSTDIHTQEEFDKALKEWE